MNLALELPNGFELIVKANISEYDRAVQRILAVPASRRFWVSGERRGYGMEPNRFDSDWYCVYCINPAVGLAGLSFDRGAGAMGPVVFCFDAEAHENNASALAAVHTLLLRYRHIEWCKSSCSELNAPSIKIHRRMFGEPWGTEPHATLDEVEGRFVGSVKWASLTVDVLGRLSRPL